MGSFKIFVIKSDDCVESSSFDLIFDCFFKYTSIPFAESTPSKTNKIKLVRVNPLERLRF